MFASQPSPTPQIPGKSLVPSSPSHISLHRNRLQRASSSESLAIVGLSNWRRMPTKAKSCDRSSHYRTGKSDGSQTKRLGEGMGMQGTPARRKRLASKPSIGNMSTPKDLGSRKHSQYAMSSSVTSAPPSSDILVSAEDMTSPSISTAGARTIVVRERSQCMLDETTNAEGSLFLGQHKMKAVLPILQDMTVPLNDLSIQTPKIQSPSDTTIQYREFVVPLNHSPLSPVDLNALNEASSSKSRWDLTIPLNDISQTPRVASTGLSSAGTKKISQHQSTPFRLQGTSGPPSPSDETSMNDESSVELPRVGARSCQKQQYCSDPFLPTDDSGDACSPTMSNYHEDVFTINLPLYDPLKEGSRSYREEILTLSDANSSVCHQSSENIIGPAIHQECDNFYDEALSTSNSLTSFGSQREWANTANYRYQTQREGSRPLTPIPPRRSSYMAFPTLTEKSAYLKMHKKFKHSSSNTWRDPFGFWWMCEAAQGKSPRPFIPSSPLQQSPPNLPSPLTTHSLSSRLSNQYTASTTSICDETPRVAMRGVWRGAEVLARMEGYGGQLKKTNHYTHHETDQEEAIGKKRKRATLNNTVEWDQPHFTAEFLKKRQERINHYKDIENNYKLEIEVVFG
ncbi:uncharacterized protein L203_103802 [Cryptococcus depauperatus CBS 7841]|uniref:Uncharacterized protein n=1 Tax=Cryptococcus depauperatus CBS 7841 TaxID=1295531 RepID=A0A1E3IG70_9TREE|nr:hypothetical protein L203_03699 [Cryptococcus depauperatus CBS 7841]